MPRFIVPAIPESTLRRLVSLDVEADFDLTDDQIATIKRDRLPLADSMYHAGFREPLRIRERPMELGALLGIHDLDPAAPAAGAKVARLRRYLHYEVRLRPTSRAQASEEGDWELARRVVGPLIPPHLATVSMRLSVESTANFPVTLPIPLPGTEAPGFSEIRGVRLVQPDPQDPSSELYSVILDQYPKYTSISIHAQAEVDFGDGILQPTLQRVIAIADLAVKETK